MAGARVNLLGSAAMLAGVLLGAALLAGAPNARAILGGSDVERVPESMAAVLLDGEFICGGSLVNSRFVLTAAHCAEDFNVEELTVALGRRSVDSVPESEQLAVESVTLAPDEADAALLGLAEPADADAAAVVAAGRRDLWAPGVRARVLGYGATTALGVSTAPLQQVTVPIRSDAECSSGLVGYDAEIELCAGNELGGRDACQGDSGGPLLVPDGRGDLLIAGVVSHGLSCGLPYQYGVYARVGAQTIREWITQTLPVEADVSDPGRLFVRRVRISPRQTRVRLVATAPLRRLGVAVRRGGRNLARIRRARIAEGPTTIRLRHRRLRPGRYRVVSRARQPGGVQVRAARRARLR